MRIRSAALLRVTAPAIALILPLSVIAEPVETERPTIQGCYHAAINQAENLPEAFGGSVSGIDLALASDGGYRFDLVLGADVSSHRGRWHRDGSRIVFDTIVSDPLIAFGNGTEWTSEFEERARSAARLVAPDNEKVARALRKGPSLAISVRPLGARQPVRHLDFTMLVRFADGHAEPAFWDETASWAIARDRGAVRTIEIHGQKGASDLPISVPIPPGTSDAQVFTLQLDVFKLVIGHEPMPPLTIEGDALIFAGDVRFVREENCR